MTLERDIVVIGAGFAGMYLLHRLRSAGFDVEVIEAGDEVGGTWYWNRYPGARCDVESVEYSYSFDDGLQQEWDWSERFATQPEILHYAQHVADRFDLRRSIRFGTRVVSGRFDAANDIWTVETDDGESTTCRWLIAAVGCLSSANVPVIAGADTFAGPTLHTGRWAHDGVDVSGQRVGIIGTGSSGVQAIPLLAEAADHLTVFQRSPTYVVPARNRAISHAERATIKAGYARLRAANLTMTGAHGSRTERGEGSALAASDAEREAVYRERWDMGGLVFLHGFGDLMVDRDANETAAAFVRARIAAIVADPAVAAKLMPTHVIGCKRLCLGTNYYETYNRPNVSLVDLRQTPIDAIVPAGIRCKDGEVHELDVLIYATGFDAMTGSLLRLGIEGVDATLADAWSSGPRTYLGIGVNGFPNLFITSGPGSPSVLTNMLTTIERQVQWIGDCLEWLRNRGAQRFEASAEAQNGWVDHVNSLADATLFPTCNSWYLGANIPGKPRVFMPVPGFPSYTRHCDDVAAAGYEGFAVTGP